MARTRTTKAVAQRIDLNYFKRPTPFKRAKLWLAIFVPVIGLVWVGWNFLRHDDRVYSSGRLSEPHAVLEKQCAACHVRQAGGFSATAADSACLACHDGPVHHDFKTKQLACMDCHTEHRGRINPSAVSNQSCALCHARLHTDTWGHILDFETTPPDFSAVKNGTRDPATIKLNHALHMRATRRGPTGPMVQLVCSDCHRSTASQAASWSYGDAKYAATSPTYTGKDEFRELSSRGLTARHPTSGRELMAPPTFANTCAGCHLLTFDQRFGEGVPHDKPDVVHAFLLKKFSAYITNHPSELHESQDPGRNLAGHENLPAMRTLTGAQWVAERVAVSEELLWHKTCAQCHVISGSSLLDVKIARWDTGDSRDARTLATSPSGLETRAPQGTLPVVAPANLTLQWLPHARFEHNAHGGFSCTGCHQNALKSTETSDILIPGIAVCQTCHAPGAGYAESRCFECHTYHDWAKRKEEKSAFTLPGLQTSGGR